MTSASPLIASVHSMPGDISQGPQKSTLCADEVSSQEMLHGKSIYITLIGILADAQVASMVKLMAIGQ